MLQNRHVGADKIANGTDTISVCCFYSAWQNDLDALEQLLLLDSLLLLLQHCQRFLYARTHHSSTRKMSIAILCNIITSWNVCCFHCYRCTNISATLILRRQHYTHLNLKFMLNAWHHCSRADIHRIFHSARKYCGKWQPSKIGLMKLLLQKQSRRMKETK